MYINTISTGCEQRCAYKSHTPPAKIMTAKVRTAAESPHAMTDRRSSKLDRRAVFSRQAYSR